MTAESHASDAPTQLSIALYTLSDTRTPTTDESGQYLREQVEAAGHTVADYRVVREDPGALRQALIDCSGRRDVQAVICTGGTGIGPRDGTYEAIEKLLDKRLEGFGELFRALSFAEIGSAAMLSRATAGLMHTTVVVALPGSPAAVRLGWEKILREQLPHMVAVAREAAEGTPADPGE
jgi:molybdenum cofactor biosynthesis protein B